MKPVLWIIPSLMLALTGLAPTARAQVFVSPNWLAAYSSGYYLGSAPFNNVGRYQQIYASTDFLPLRQPGLITQLAFRPAGVQGAPFTHTFTNIQFLLSTTTQSIAGLNSTFSANVGTNEMIVFNGALIFSTSNSVTWGSAKQFDLVVNLTTPFWYDPSAGNLLLEIRNFSSGFAGYLDADADSSGDSVRLNYLDDSANGPAGTVQDYGLVTRFYFQGGVPPAAAVVPELAALDQAMTNYLVGHAFEAGTLALMKNSKLVFRQGYGWRETNLVQAAHPDNLFRLASISKTITGCAINKLLSAGAFSTSTKVYSYLGIPPWGGTLTDSRITNITVQHLLDHTAGWNRDVSPIGDPVFSTIQISTQMGLTYPAAPTNVISWVFSKPLDFAPGASNVYSNFGYDVLGRVVEKASGKTYINYLIQNLLGPSGITNIIQSRSRPRDLDPWEIWYQDFPYLYQSAVDYPTNLLARFADGGGYYESYDAFGGLSASAPALCKFMQNYWLAGAQRVPGSPYTWNYIFYGSLPGATTVIHQSVTQNSSSTNALEFAALFNTRIGNNDNDEAHTALVNAANTITSWPANGGGAFQWSVAATNVDKNAGTVIVQITRSGLSTLPVKVSYSTFNRTAATNNYVPASGVLSFASGEISKNVVVGILNDGRMDPTLQFSLELISASGGAWLGDRVTAFVNILDNSTPPQFIQPVYANGIFHAQITGATGLVVRVDRTTNFVNWLPFQTLTNTSGMTPLTDSNLLNGARTFYRAVVNKN